MNRRDAVLAIIAAGAAPLDLMAQQQGKVWRVGFFYFGSRQSAVETGRYNAFLEGMRGLGYEEGKQFIIDARFGDGKSDLLPGLAADMVRSKVDLILASGTPTYRVLQKATSTIPIVITVGGDPVAEGYVVSLARPGGNITGLINMTTDATPKLLDLVISAVPRLSRIAVLKNPINGAHAAQLQSLQDVAQKRRMNVLTVDAQSVMEIERGFAAMAHNRVQAVIILNDSFLIQRFRQIAELAIKYRLPSIFGTHEYAEWGGLMGYGADVVDNFRHAASYVDRIFKGAKPAELPIERPTRFKLVINRKSAKALGLTLSKELLLRADKVIE